MKNHEYEEKLFKLDRNFNKYVTIEANNLDLSDKVSFAKLDELKDQFHNF